eukprot:gnl/Dysnectes_brevis/7872_a13617_217.p1 GENE.gnl/Dysnectes_brevis/7872_a13617_217~~gnl/Dysnectes_brevis/7872_a13617_217.p1  ORF type:complete len:350 (-),score=46.79 gnl/Dysnectes_brevis/7872_a13617_217:70-1119(-)
MNGLLGVLAYLSCSNDGEFTLESLIYIVVFVYICYQCIVCFRHTKAVIYSSEPEVNPLSPAYIPPTPPPKTLKRVRSSSIRNGPTAAPPPQPKAPVTQPPPKIRPPRPVITKQPARRSAKQLAKQYSRDSNLDKLGGKSKPTRSLARPSTATGVVKQHIGRTGVKRPSSAVGGGAVSGAGSGSGPTRRRTLRRTPTPVIISPMPPLLLKRLNTSVVRARRQAMLISNIRQRGEAAQWSSNLSRLISLGERLQSLMVTDPVLAVQLASSPSSMASYATWRKIVRQILDKIHDDRLIKAALKQMPRPARVLEMVLVMHDVAVRLAKQSPAASTAVITLGTEASKVRQLSGF